MALDAESVEDCSTYREEFLRRSDAVETLHAVETGLKRNLQP